MFLGRRTGWEPGTISQGASLLLTFFFPLPALNVRGHEGLLSLFGEWKETVKEMQLG